VPELTQAERLQPSLLDRLTDNEPGKTMESRAQRVLSLQKLREGVVRDLLWLLGTTRLDVSADLAAYPEARRSVINFGIEGIAGVAASSLDGEAVARQVREAIAVFEPRLKKGTVQVRVTVAEANMAANSLAFEIEGDLWAGTIPMRLYLKTELDLEDGSVKVVDATRGGG
jgi:type VI secretion system protein ImpF